MNRRYVAVGAALIVASIVLAGCELWFPAPDEDAPARADPSPEPTLNLDEIPILGDDDPAPPVPLLVNDPRFPIAPVEGDTYEVGQQLYERHCAACHGVNGEGQLPDPLAPGAAPPHNGDGHTWHHSDQQNFATVWQGRQYAGAVMPAFHDRLTPDEIALILAYIKTWWEPGQLHQQMAQTQQIIDGFTGAAE